MAGIGAAEASLRGVCGPSQRTFVPGRPDGQSSGENVALI